MNQMLKDRKFSIRLTVLSLFLIISGLTAGLALGLHYYFSKDLATTAAEKSFRGTSDKVRERILTLDRQSVELVNILSNYRDMESPPETNVERSVISLLSSAMEQNENLYAVYVGYENGDFYELINLESSKYIRKNVGAAAHDRWVVIKVGLQNGERVKISDFYDQHHNKRASRSEPANYDPRQRPWYIKALGGSGVTKTSPYIFSNLKAPGVTYAKAVDNPKRVVAVDISLAGLSEFLKKQRLLPGSEAFLFDAKGDIIAQTVAGDKVAQEIKPTLTSLTAEERAFIASHPVIKASNEMDWPPFDFAMSGKPRGYSIDLLKLLAGKAGIGIEFVNGYTWNELVDLFQKGDLDLLHSLVRNKDREKIGLFTESYMPMPQVLAYRLGMPPLSTLGDLAGLTLAMPKGWATEAYLKKNHPEIKLLQVSGTLDALRAVSEKRADAALDSKPVLQYLIKNYHIENLELSGDVPELKGAGDSGLHFLVQPDMPLLQKILNKALAATQDERRKLERDWFGPRDSTQETDSVRADEVPHRELIELAQTVGPDGNMKTMNIKGKLYLGYAARLESVYGSDEYIGFLAPMAETIRPYMSKVRFSLLVTLFLQLLLIPIVWYFATLIVGPIKALAHESEKVKQRRYDDVSPVDSHITEIVDLSHSLVSMAASIKAYEEAQRELMDAFIRLIAVAIDRKSPYTGGHCERVPELAVMLARVAGDNDNGPFKDFKLVTEDEWREFQVAAWLHDCGKVTTPEYIVDKGTKLETIYNRIHEIRMRFEVLLRDAEIEFWKKMAEGADSTANLEEKLRARQEQIKDDFAFVASCNLGGEFMAEDKVERIKSIAQTTWVRHLDDRLGLSPIEALRYPKNPPTLPCPEPLLSDRPEHIIERPGRAAFGKDGPEFKMTVPEHMYNQGEIYNLGISRGTLTPEDRYKINEHIVSTIRMLETLPYPENMTRIPEYAGAHHETLAGTGYPRKLTEEEISIPARILAISDVFEALTASDRPYKEPKTLGQSIKIMSFMVKDRHIDADLFELFLTSGVYLQYAEKYLKPEQIDDPNIEDYIGKN